MVYLLTLSTADYQKVLVKFISLNQLNEHFMHSFIWELYRNSGTFEEREPKKYEAWIRDQAEYFCYVYRKKRQPGRHIERPGKISIKKRYQVVA